MSAEVRFGIIGCGLMGREFASVSMRWLHLTGDLAPPRDRGGVRFLARKAFVV